MVLGLALRILIFLLGKVFSRFLSKMNSKRNGLIFGDLMDFEDNISEESHVSDSVWIGKVCSCINSSN